MAELLDKLAEIAEMLPKPIHDFGALLDVAQIAKVLNCSSRHVYRMVDAGRMPPPVRLGALVRWSRQAIEDWIAGGCRPIRQTGRV